MKSTQPCGVPLITDTTIIHLCAAVLINWNKIHSTSASLAFATGYIVLFRAPSAECNGSRLADSWAWSSTQKYAFFYRCMPKLKKSRLVQPPSERISLGLHYLKFFMKTVVNKQSMWGTTVKVARGVCQPTVQNYIFK